MTIVRDIVRPVVRAIVSGVVTGNADPNPAFVQQVAAGGTATNATTLVLTLSGITTTAGNHLVACVASRSGPVLSVVDSKGNSWTIDEQATVAGGCSAIASCKITTPLVNADTITVSIGSSTGLSASCAEFSGLAAAAHADVQASAGDAVAGLAADSTAAATSAAANSLVIGVVGHQSTVGAFTPEVLSPIWNQGTTAASVGTVQTVRPLYRVVSATGAFATKATWTSSRIWAAAVAVYK